MGGGSVASTVRILLSTDGGNSFGSVLAISTPNDGIQSVAIPNVATTHGRIWVEGGIFYDVSDGDFSIVPPDTLAVPMVSPPVQVSLMVLLGIAGACALLGGRRFQIHRPA